MSEWAFINNDFIADQDARLHYRDLVFQRGYGVFDFLKVMNGIPVFLEDHLDRFFYSSGQLNLEVPLNKQQLEAVIVELIRKNEAVHCGIRLSLTGGYSPDGYNPAEPNLVVSVHRFQLPTPDDFSRGIRLMSHAYQRQLPHIKTIDYLMAVMLQPRLKEINADDILYHQDGNITECPRANFFIVTAANKLVTPSLNILKGITRARILNAATSLMEVEERNLSMEELKSAKEAFITSTTKMVLPDQAVDDIRFPAERTMATRINELLFQLHPSPRPGFLATP